MRRWEKLVLDIDTLRKIEEFKKNLETESGITEIGFRHINTCWSCNRFKDFIAELKVPYRPKDAPNGERYCRVYFCYLASNVVTDMMYCNKWLEGDDRD
jgi:hypothetical protein